MVCGRAVINKRDVSGLRLFEDRLKREDRLEQFIDKVRWAMLKYGWLWGHARSMVAKEFGYVGVEQELSLLNEHEAQQMKSVEHFRREEEEMELENRVRERELEEELERFDEMLVKLPDGPTDDDMTWVRTHPAMSRKQRTGEDVVISSADITGAPSKAAVNMLVNWANDPQKFFQLVLQADKKRLEQRSPDIEEEVEDDLTDAEQLLAQFSEDEDV